jgi:hypothetical protein
MSNLISVHLEMVLVSEQDRCTVCAKRTIGSESFWMHPVVHLGDDTQVVDPFDPHVDSVNLDAR